MKSVYLILGLFLAGNVNAQTTYFVDNLSGNDLNSGRFFNTAFKTIKKVNQLNLNFGDSVLFRRGGSWTGNLISHGSGSVGKRIVIGAYGNGTSPILDAKGIVAESENASYTIRLFNQEFFEIRDLKIKNFQQFEKPTKVNSSGIVSYTFFGKIMNEPEDPEKSKANPRFICQIKSGSK